MIQATCRGCGHQFQVKQPQAGKKVKCPCCGDPTLMAVAPPAPPAAPAALHAPARVIGLPAALSLSCPACAASFSPADDLRGKPAFCPRCGQALMVSSA